VTTAQIAAICTIAAMNERLGVLAFGDSITNGGGELQWGVALQSWALWTARCLALPYTGYAVDGARVNDVVTQQLRGFMTQTGGDRRYDVGCLYIGVNDVRAVDWNPETFSADHAHALHFLAGRCDRVLAVTAPRRLGRPPADAKVPSLNAIITRNAGARGALIVDLGDFGARNQVMVDHVHPTAFGQIAIGERALAVLAADGLPTRVSPAALFSYRSTRSQRLRADLTYVYRDLKQRTRTTIGQCVPQRR
jgi:lysophospholipase L1-like esterase